MIVFIIKIFPWLIFAYGLWTGANIYKEHQVEYEMIDSGINDLKLKIGAKKKKVKSLEKYADKEEIERRLNKSTEELKKLNKKLPKQINDADVFSYLNKLALGVLIKNPILEKSGEITHQFYAENNYKFLARANFLQFILFFKELFNSERFFKVKEFRLARMENKKNRRYETIKGEILIESYKQK